jgi:hypothetical protein
MQYQQINKDIGLPAQQPGSKEGVYLDDLADGTTIEIETQHRNYKLIKRTENHVRISGHPTYCPDPVEVEFEGSFSTGGAVLMPNPGFIGRGMYLVFKHPLFGWVTTSRIREIHKLS